MDFHEIYGSGAEGYQALVGAEDVDGNLTSALAPLVAPADRIVEIGAGTGRVTRLLRALGNEVVATELSADMIGVAARLQPIDEPVDFCLADAAALPFAGGVFDTAVAGWVYGHQVEWQPQRWQEIIAGFVTECERVTGDGTIIIIETLGTGHDAPNPPPSLIGYYDWLESTLGFTRRWIRTDYGFPTVEQAATVTGNFFGPEFAETVRANGWHRVPECTGIWTRSR